MRPAVGLALLMLASALVPPAHAEPIPDATGDVAAAVTGPSSFSVPVSIPSGVADFADLTSFDIEATEDVVVFQLDVVKMDKNSVALRYDVVFSWNGVDYLARLFPYPFRVITGDSPVIRLFRVDSDGALGYVGALDGRYGVVSNRATIEVPRGLILDAEGHMPSQGALLEGVQARTVAWIQPAVDGHQGVGFTLTDAVPDGPAAFAWRTTPLAEASESKAVTAIAGDSAAEAPQNLELAQDAAKNVPGLTTPFAILGLLSVALFTRRVA